VQTLPPSAVPVDGEIKRPVVAEAQRLRRMKAPEPAHAAAVVWRVMLPVQPVALASKLNE
jgi:hypothetical protein